ncbi:hypothetical protein scyTo_0005829 [Scyliorhinus torazame]|uniref:Uncharacterized protein n=1 Tax=Scyliorhinus torazame TaxID=75743 RepID=A0A401PD48_SCYTO|nr:hypothetical protein [Scyliorhinus torazame]
MLTGYANSAVTRHESGRRTRNPAASLGYRINHQDSAASDPEEKSPRVKIHLNIVDEANRVNSNPRFSVQIPTFHDISGHLCLSQSRIISAYHGLM